MGRYLDHVRFFVLSLLHRASFHDTTSPVERRVCYLGAGLALGFQGCYRFLLSKICNLSRLRICKPLIRQVIVFHYPSKAKLDSNVPPSSFQQTRQWLTSILPINCIVVVSICKVWPKTIVWKYYRP